MGSASESSLVTIEVKACLRDPPSSSESGLSKALGTARGLVEVDRAFLTWEFFQAKLQRWQHGRKPHITFEISSEFNASEGARLLKERLEAEASSWTEVDWWMAASADLTGACSAVLQIAHFAMMDEILQEVIKVFHLFRLPSSKPVCDIAAEVDSELVLNSVRLLPEPIKSLRSLRGVMANVESTSNIGAWKKLAGRLLAGVQPCEEVMTLLIEAYLSFFDWPPLSEAGVEYHDGGFAVFGQPFPKFSAVDQWFQDQLAEAIQRCPASISVVAHKVRERCMALQDFTKVATQVDHDGGLTWIYPPADTLWAERLLSSCCHALLVGPHLHPEKASEMIQAFVSHGHVFRDSIVYGEVSRVFTPTVDPRVFAVGALEMQRFLLGGETRLFYEANLRDNAHLIHEKARHLLLDVASCLSSGDLEYLADASFLDEEDQDDKSTESAPCTEE